MFGLTVNGGGLAGTPQVQAKPAGSSILSTIQSINVAKPVKTAGAAILSAIQSINVAKPKVAGSSILSMVQSINVAKPVKIAGVSIISMIKPTNVITPSYALTMEPGPYDVSRIDPSVFSTKKFGPYEQMTGVSQERPEIIMMTGFLPLFAYDTNRTQEAIEQIEANGYYPFMTPAGRFIDAQLTARTLRFFNITGMLSDLRKHDQSLDQDFINRQQEFGRTVDALSDTASFLLTLIKNMNRLKEQLDLRDDLYEVDTQATAMTQMVNGITGNTVNSISLESKLASVRKFIPATYTMTDALVSLGFERGTVKSVFSSTKIWLQLMLELKIILQSHSLEFIDVNPASRKNDASAAAILRDGVKRFSLSSGFLVPDMASITNTPVNNLPSVLNVVNQDFQNIYVDAALKSDEIKIAALINLISKEFKYSFGLAQQPTQRILADGFGFNVVSTDNRKLFDAVLGQVGGEISDVPATETRSMASIAQRQLTNDEVALTFESKYVVGDTGTLTPGSSFFVDHVLRTDGKTFDTSRIDELSSQLRSSYDRFNAVISSLDLLSRGSTVEQENKDFRFTLSNQHDFLNYLLSYLVNVNSGETLDLIKNDSLAAVYSHAQKHNDIKSILFLYTMCRISRSYQVNIPLLNVKLSLDNTTTSDALIEQLLVALRKNVDETKVAFLDRSAFVSGLNMTVAGVAANFGKLVTTPNTPVTINKKGIGIGGIGGIDVTKLAVKLLAPVTTPGTMSVDAIRTAMKHGTPLTNFIETTISKVLSTFRAGPGTMTDGKTRFGGHIDTTMMMIVFDLLVTMITKFNSQSIVSVSPVISSGVATFNIVRNSSNHSDSVRDLTMRIDREAALVQKLTYAVLNALKNLAGSLQTFSTYLQSPTSIKKLGDVTAVLPDPTMLQMLFSEQQIMMLASTIYDLRSNLNDRVLTGTTDEFLVLDSSNVTPELQSALYGLLGNGEFTLARGFNKRVLTIGIPLGFSKHLQQSVKLNNLKKTSFTNKQNDIVSIVVYKTDLKNPDVVYKPQRFLFELSRFPARGQQSHLSIPTNPTVNDVVNAVPTRDFNQSLKSGYDTVHGTVGGDPVTEGSKVAFADEAYSFLSDAQKAEILRNNVVSYLMETYISLLTGINVGDHHFSIIDTPTLLEPDFVKVLTDSRLQQVVNVVPTVTKAASLKGISVSSMRPGVFFTSTLPATTQSGQQSGTTKAKQAAPPTSPVRDPSLPPLITIQPRPAVPATIAPRHIAGLLTDMSVISGISRTLTPLSSGLLVSKKLLQPKQFDRVFNVIIDPDDFQIDYDQTMKTMFGNQALEQMITNGDVVPEQQNNQIFRRMLVGRNQFGYGGNVPVAGSTLYRDRDKNPGDMTFEKYFVTIETFDESEQ